MNALQLVGANDGVAEGRTILEDEDSVFTASVRVGVALTSTVKLLVAHVFASRDAARGGERHDAANAAGDVERLCSAQRGHKGNDRGSLEAHIE